MMLLVDTQTGEVLAVGDVLAATEGRLVVNIRDEWQAVLRQAGRKRLVNDAILVEPPVAVEYESQAERDDKATAAAAVTSLQAYIAEASPSAASTVQAVKLLCRIAIILIKRALHAT